MGAPAFISYPHFFEGDRELIDNVTGMNPSEDKHAFYIDLIPVSKRRNFTVLTTTNHQYINRFGCSEV